MSGTYQGVPLFWQYRGGVTRPCAQARQANRVLTQGRRGVQGRPGTNRLERLENEFAALFVGGGGVKILKIFF